MHSTKHSKHMLAFDKFRQAINIYILVIKNSDVIRQDETLNPERAQRSLLQAHHPKTEHHASCYMTSRFHLDSIGLLYFKRKRPDQYDYSWSDIPYSKSLLSVGKKPFETID